jgi:hypothetical protein
MKASPGAGASEVMWPSGVIAPAEIGNRNRQKPVTAVRDEMRRAQQLRMSGHRPINVLKRYNESLNDMENR